MAATKGSPWMDQASPGRTRTLAGPGPRFANVHSRETEHSVRCASTPRDFPERRHNPYADYCLKQRLPSPLGRVVAADAGHPRRASVHLYYGHLLPVGEYSIADFPPASAGPATSPHAPGRRLHRLGRDGASLNTRLSGWGISGRRPSGRSGRTGRPSPTCATSPTGFPGASPASPASRPPTLPMKRRRRWKST